MGEPAGLHRSLLEAASWRLAAELVRRHPEDLSIMRTHPGGGQYDCLTIVWTRADPPVPAVQLNRHGTIQVHHGAHGSPRDAPRQFTWLEYLCADPYEFVWSVEDAARLEPPGSVPAATPSSLTFRLLAAAATTGCLGVHRVENHCGYLVTSGMGGGVREALFAAFPGAQAARANRLPGDLLNTPEYRFWFLTVDEDPVLAVETTGRCWNAVGEEFDLMALYEHNVRRLWPVLTAVVGHHLR